MRASTRINAARSDVDASSALHLRALYYIIRLVGQSDLSLIFPESFPEAESHQFEVVE